MTVTSSPRGHATPAAGAAGPGDAAQASGNRRTAWAAARHILAIRLDTLGDVLMTTPAIRALRESGPKGRRVTLLTSPAGAAAARLVPEIDDVLVFEAPWLKASGPSSGADVRAMADDLAARGFDGAVVFTVFSQNPLPAAMLCHLAGIPLRAAHCRENPYQLLTDWVPETELTEPTRHEVRRQLDLAAAIGATTDDERLSLAVPAEAAARVDAALAELGVDAARRWVAIHPGATAPSRRYAPVQFGRVARLLHERLGAQLVFTGSESERDLVEEIRAAAGVASVSTVGRFDLAGLGALLQRAPLLVANNTGPVHVAAAVGTPVVDIYALTNTQHTPWGVPSRVLSHDVPCRNCLKSVCPMGHHDCLRLVEPEDVVRAAADLLGLPIATSPHRRPWRDLSLGRPALPVLPTVPAAAPAAVAASLVDRASRHATPSRPSAPRANAIGPHAPLPARNLVDRQRRGKPR